jgi:sugar phosphate isomerase/epimerase
MKLSMMSYTMARQAPPGDFDIAGMCRFTRELGLEAIDFITTYGADPCEVRKMVDDEGLKVCCYTFGSDINYPDAAARKPGVDAIKRGVEIAAILGADKVMMHIGGKRELSREQSRRNGVAGLTEALAAVAGSGITVTIESLGGGGPISPFVVSADLLEAVHGAPGLKLTYDNGNIFTGGEDPVAAFKAIAPHVVHAHLKDWYVVSESEGWQGLDLRYYKGALVGEGEVDQRGCLAAMKQSGYNGFINIEYEGNDYPADVAMRRAVPYLTELIAGLP